MNPIEIPEGNEKLLHTGSSNIKSIVEIKGLKLSKEEYLISNIDEFVNTSEETRLNHKIKAVRIFWFKECVVGL